MLRLVRALFSGNFREKVKNAFTFLCLCLLAFMVLGYIRHNMKMAEELKVTNTQLEETQQKLFDSLAEYQKAAAAWSAIYATMHENNKEGRAQFEALTKSIPHAKAYADVIVPSDIVRFVREGE